MPNVTFAILLAWFDVYPRETKYSIREKKCRSGVDLLIHWELIRLWKEAVKYLNKVKLNGNLLK